ncbi:MAG: serine hydrolase family protein [Bacteroidetes bacterium]|nr:serine hydrolase family protein [Bacteroidota bacterium]
MNSETNFLVIPGYGNSDKDHWQTFFETQLTNCHRIEQESWENPQCEDWINTINNTVIRYDADSLVLVSHSMGGIAIAHWASRFNTKIKGAFIVAPPDLENPYLDLNLESFTPIPTLKLPFPSIVIGSSNDNWATLERTQTFADNWGSKLIIIGVAGHINTTSGYGKWENGLNLLKQFADENPI